MTDPARLDADPHLRVVDLALALMSTTRDAKAAVFLTAASGITDVAELDDLAADVLALEPRTAELLAAPAPLIDEKSRMQAVLPSGRRAIITVAATVSTERLRTLTALAAGAQTPAQFEAALDAAWTHKVVAESVASTIEALAPARRAGYFALVADQARVMGVPGAMRAAGDSYRPLPGPAGIER